MCVWDVGDNKTWSTWYDLIYCYKYANATEVNGWLPMW